MNKVLALSCCLMGLEMACAPAYASPTNKKITLSCDVTSGTDVITGTATVTLCDTPNCSGGTQVACLANPISCDSSGVSAPISITMPCGQRRSKWRDFTLLPEPHPFKVTAPLLEQADWM
jgi:hypothetical protein